MRIVKQKIPDVILLEPEVHYDHRGFVFENFHHSRFENLIEKRVSFVLELHSFSKQNVLRGMHYQLSPVEQGKLIRVVSGKVLDVAVDIRANSKTFGKWVSVVLSSDKKQVLWVPEGFAHGFFVISETADLLYKMTNYYSPEHERCIQWNDMDLAINWPISSDPIISDRDKLRSMPFAKATPL